MTIETKEAAKMIRTLLKERFPATKFSVRMKSFSMGSSIDIDWTDGPTAARVQEITGPFATKGFDGMTDSTTYTTAWMIGGRVFYKGVREEIREICPEIADQGDTVSCYAWIHTTRKITTAFAKRAVEQIAAYWGGVEIWPVFREESGWGYSIDPATDKPPRADLGGNGTFHHYSWSSMINRACGNRLEFTRKSFPPVNPPELEPAGSAAVPGSPVAYGETERRVPVPAFGGGQCWIPEARDRSMTTREAVLVPAEELERQGQYFRQVRHSHDFDEIYEAMYHANQLRRKWLGKPTYMVERSCGAPIPEGF